MSLLCRDQLRKLDLYALFFMLMVVSMGGYVTVADAQQFRVVPSISIREMYDTNVFYADKDRLPSGLSADDFITTVVPQINLSQTNSLISTNLSAGAIIQKFARNSNLDNVGFNFAAGLDVSRLANRYLPRMRTARVYGTYMFSPSTPAFGAGGMGVIGGGGGLGMMGGTGGLAVTGPLDSGLVAQRIRTSIYNIGVSTSYALSPSADFQTSVTYSRLSFGGSFTPTTTGSGQAVVFDTTNYNVTAGPTARISATDSLGFAYTFSQFSQANFGNFSTHSGRLTWARTWTREISSTAAGGLTLVEPIPSFQPNNPNTQLSERGRVAATMFPTGGFAVTYASASSLLRSVGSEVQSLSSSGGVGVVGGGFLPVLAGSTVPGTIAKTGMYSVSLTYNLGVFPSFVSSAGPIYTHLIGLNSSAGITDRLTTFAGFNFAHSSFTSQTNNTTFDTYGSVVMLNYLIGRTLTASLTHQWLNFVGSSGGIDNTEFSFSKHVLMVGISYAFAPRGDFFRAGAFWDGATPSDSSGGVTPGKSGTGGVDIKK